MSTSASVKASVPPGPTGPVTAHLALNSIAVMADRLRAADPHRVAVLADALVEGGQIQPIVVRQYAAGPEPYQLVAGLHRLEAARSLGWAVIRAEIHDLDADVALLHQIYENLIRSDLRGLDRAIFLSELKTLWTRMHPASGRGGARKAGSNLKVQSLDFEQPDPFWKEAMRRSDLSRSAIMAAVSLIDRLCPGVVVLLRSMEIAESAAELERIAAESSENQLLIVHQLQSGQARNVEQARITLGLVTPTEADPAEQRYNRFVDLAARATAKDRRRMGQHLVNKLPTNEQLNLIKAMLEVADPVVRHHISGGARVQ